MTSIHEDISKLESNHSSSHVIIIPIEPDVESCIEAMDTEIGNRDVPEQNLGEEYEGQSDEKLNASTPIVSISDDENTEGHVFETSNHSISDIESQTNNLHLDDIATNEEITIPAASSEGLVLNVDALLLSINSKTEQTPKILMIRRILIVFVVLPMIVVNFYILVFGGWK